MKKYIALSLIFLLVLSVFAGCKKTYDVDATINKLKDKGFIVSENYDTSEDLTLVNTMLNSTIQEHNGNFTVSLTRMVTLNLEEDLSKNCQIFVFENARQAEKTTEFYTANRTEDAFLYVARNGNVMIVTNSDIAKQTINLKFS